MPRQEIDLPRPLVRASVIAMLVFALREFADFLVAVIYLVERIGQGGF